MDNRIQAFCEYLNHSHSAYHAQANLVEILKEQGYTQLEEAAKWSLIPGGKYYVCRGGATVIAFRIPASNPQGFLISAAHTDRPSFKLKENGEKVGAYTGLAVERYGGALMAPWLDRREQEFLDADSLCGLMLEAQRQSYGDGLDQKCMPPYMWLCKSHYYGSTFYNFPYAFGGLFARGLYARYEQEGADFVPKYKKLLFTTPIATAEEVAKVADIDLTDVDFWRSALKTVAEKIDLFCNLVP